MTKQEITTNNNTGSTVVLSSVANNLHENTPAIQFNHTTMYDTLATKQKSTTPTGYGQKLATKLQKNYEVTKDDLANHATNLNLFVKILSTNTITTTQTIAPIESTNIDNVPDDLNAFKEWMNKTLNLKHITKTFNPKDNKFPLVQKLSQSESSKFTNNQMEDAAIALNFLITIDSILECSKELICGALKQVVASQANNSEEEKKTDQSESKEEDEEDLILSLCNQLNLEDEQLLEKLCKNLGIEDPQGVDDESKERGFFASIKHNVVYAFFHPIEFVQETIWGKKKVHRSSDDGIEEKHTEAAENEHDDHSKSYFEPIKNIFAWIPYFGSFFSTRNETKENKHEVALNLQDNDTQEDKRKVALNLQDIEKSTEVNNLGIEITDQLEEGKLYCPLDIPEKLTQEMLELMSIDIIKKINEKLTTLKLTNNNQDLINLINLCSTVLDNKGNESDYSENEDCDTLGSDSN
jgi:hypothetical protein